MSLTLEHYVQSGYVVRDRDERPWAHATCAGCGTRWVAPLHLEDGTVVLSALRWLLRAECDECAARADALVGERAFEVRRRESGMPQALADAVSWESLISEAGSADDTVRRERAIEAARAWATDRAMDAKGVWLHGPQGSGKTRLVATAALERMRHTPVRWVSVAVLITELDGAWNDEDRKRALKVLTDPGCIALDDLDKVVPTDRVRHALFTALEKREQAGVGICVTSNNPPSKVGEMFSSPFMSRLLSMTQPLAYPGVDRRLTLVPS